MAAALRDECTAGDNASGVPDPPQRDGAARGLEIEARFQDPRVKTLHLKKNYFFFGRGRGQSPSSQKRELRRLLRGMKRMKSAPATIVPTACTTVCPCAT